MAGSRRETVGSIITRIRGLLNSEALKYQDRPLWYDVVTAKPPLPTPASKPVQKILYPEDFVRVQFYHKYADPSAGRLSDEKKLSIPQRFINKYFETREQNTDSSVNLFDETVKRMQQEGVHLLTHEEKRAFKQANQSRQRRSQSYDSSPSSEASINTDSLIDNLFKGDQEKK